jgi:glycosyltransferase involved in cell wall biosynthesis
MKTHLPRLPVSIIIPTYNRATLLPRAIASALAAVEPDDEIIVVDDGSTDATATVLASYGSQIRSLRITHAGPGAARNRGLREARRPLIAFLDSDDEWMPDKLLLQRAVLHAYPDVIFCFSDFAHRTARGQEQHGYLAHWHHDPRSWDEILGPGVRFSTLAHLPPGREDFSVHVGDLYPSALRADYVFTSTILIRRALAHEDLRFPEDVTLYEDQDCFARLARRAPVAYLACETAWNHAHGGARLTGGDTLRRALARLTLLHRVWGADPAFLGRYGAQYERIVAAQHLLKARGLLRLGHTREAREALRRAGGGPLSHRLLAACPRPLARGLVEVGRTLQAYGLLRRTYRHGAPSYVFTLPDEGRV